MRKALILLLIIASPITRAAGQEDEAKTEKTVKPPLKKKKECTTSPRDATVLSMMGWGVALAVGIATLCSLLDDNPTTTSTTNTGT